MILLSNESVNNYANYKFTYNVDQRIHNDDRFVYPRPIPNYLPTIWTRGYTRLIAFVYPRPIPGILGYDKTCCAKTPHSK